MKTLFTSLILLFVMGASAFSATETEIIAKLKEIDSKMTQGTVKYQHSVYKEEIEDKTAMTEMVYADLKNYKFRYTHKTSKSNIDLSDYYNGKNYIGVYPKEKHIILSTITDSYDFNGAYPRNQFDFGAISTNPCLRYGRGISLLEDLKIDPVNNIATGIIPEKDKRAIRSKIVAYLDPKLDYAAYKMERIYSVSDLPKEVMENSKPILVDEKYYIYSESTIDYNSKRRKPNTIRIISATFAKPAEKDYMFDWKNNTYDIKDFRGTKKQDVAVNYKRADLPKDITFDELLKMTKRKAVWEKIKSDFKNIVTTNPTSEDSFTITPANLIRILIAIAAIILLIVFFSRKRKMNSV